MTQFKIGDRVKCIKVDDFHPNPNPGNLPPLVLHREYIVYDINICSCGSVALDVGIGKLKVVRTHCYMCADLTPPSSIHWCAAKRFIKVQEKKEYIAVESSVEIEEPVLS